MMWFVPRCAASPPPRADDAALAARIAHGERAALDEAYRRESGAVYRYALALSGNPASAADATQEAFIALATRPQNFDAARGALGAWLAGVARHALLAAWRRDRLSAADAPTWDESADDPDPGAPSAESPELLLVRAQSNAQVWAAVRRLPFALREALVLVDLQERPYAEAARIAGIELNTLRTRLHRARARLAARLNTNKVEGVPR